MTGLEDILSPGSAAKWRNASKPHYVYEFWSGDTCLYIGCTVQPAGRIGSHQTKDWWHRVTRIVAEVYPDKELGRHAETQAIHRHQPIYNIQQTEKALGPRS